MNILLSLGTKIVVFALLSYTIFIIMEQRSKQITNKIIFFLTFGLLLDVVATIFMIIGSPNSPFTLHGFIGYSALFAMLIDTVLIWRYKLSNPSKSEVSTLIHQFSRYAYLWWLAAFITGALMVFLK